MTAQTFQNPTQVPQTFPDLLKLYKEKEADSNIDLNLIQDIYTRPGAEMRKNGAIQALPGLRSELVRIVEQSAGAIFLSGSSKGIESFVVELQDLTECSAVIVSAKEMYTEIAKHVDKGLRQDRRFSMDTLNSFTYGVISVLEKIEVDGIPSPNLVPYFNKVLPDFESVVNLVRDALQSIKDPQGNPVGSGLNAIYLQLRAAEEAIKEEIDNTFIPVIVLDALPEEIEGNLAKILFFGRNVSFEAKGESVERNDVVRTANELKKARKASK